MNMSSDLGKSRVGEEAVAKPLRAYAVLEEDENTGGIIFARHNVTARRLGADEYADGEFGAVSCHRAPWADAFAGKAVPAALMVEHGWHFECSGCGLRVDQESLDERGLPVCGVIGTQHSMVFCCSTCEQQWEADKADEEAEKERILGILTDMVASRFPGIQAKARHAYCPSYQGVRVCHQAWVEFNFPGMQIAPAVLRIEHRHGLIGPPEPTYTVCRGDIAAYEAFASLTPGVQS